jgi:hypothetical protein
MVAQQLQRIHVLGIAPDDSLHEFDLKVQCPRLLAGRSFFSRTAFDRHTTPAIVEERPTQVKRGTAKNSLPPERVRFGGVAATVHLHSSFYTSTQAKNLLATETYKLRPLAESKLRPAFGEPGEVAAAVLQRCLRVPDGF